MCPEARLAIAGTHTERVAPQRWPRGTRSGGGLASRLSKLGVTTTGDARHRLSPSAGPPSTEPPDHRGGDRTRPRRHRLQHVLALDSHVTFRPALAGMSMAGNLPATGIIGIVPPTFAHRPPLA